MTSRERAKALAEDIVRQWFSRSLGSMNGWEKWKPIWTDQLTEQFHKALAAPALGWTKERPNKTGLWWHRAVGEVDFPEVVELTAINQGNDFWVHYVGLAEGDYLSDMTESEFAGPLEVPT